VIGQNDVTTDQIPVGELPGGEQGIVDQVVGQKFFSILGADSQEKDGGQISGIKDGEAIRLFAPGFGWIHALLALAKVAGFSKSKAGSRG
jgi:hypothetical protein